jgi:hypothetical protein
VHNVTDFLGVIQFTLRPNMLLVPGITLIPCTGNKTATIKQRDLGGVATDTVSVFVVTSNIFVAIIVGIEGMRTRHQILKMLIKITGGRIAGGCATGVFN